jgi:hypothetical protein
MEASNSESDVTIQFLVGGLVIHFAGIFYLSCSIQKFKNFMLLQQLRNFSIFWGKYDPKIFLANLDTPKRHFLEKICVD